MPTNSKETAPPNERRLVGLIELFKGAVRGWDDVEAGELMPVAEIKARYGQRG